MEEHQIAGTVACPHAKALATAAEASITELRKCTESLSTGQSNPTDSFDSLITRSEQILAQVQERYRALREHLDAHRCHNPVAERSVRAES
jgi:hypothetical protein